jgi:hypothetical protein
LGIIQDMCPDDTDKGREAFSKIKNLVRKAAERTREALNDAVAQVLRAIRPQDVVGWFAHCDCYESRDQYSRTMLSERRKAEVQLLRMNRLPGRGVFKQLTSESCELWPAKD